jgi:hypothetical protein
MNRSKKAAVAALAAWALLLGGVAAAHTSGNQSFSAAAYAPSRGSNFIGLGDNDCESGAYGTGCWTGNRQVNVTPEVRVKLADGTWSAWGALIPAQAKYCPRTSDNQHCSANSTTNIVDTSPFGCACIDDGRHQYRTKVAARYTNPDGTWRSWVVDRNPAAGSPGVWGSVCKEL